MSAATLERPVARPSGTDGVRTLEELVTTAWGRLAAGSAVACPVCEGDMRPAPQATGAGACAACGTTLR